MVYSEFGNQKLELGGGKTYIRSEKGDAPLPEYFTLKPDPYREWDVNNDRQACGAVSCSHRIRFWYTYLDRKAGMRIPEEIGKQLLQKL